ncbi:MAG: hypothetical protein U1C96_10250 [Gallionella sp.]|nr:hypothetical protein [Gallionella sp.]
MSKMQVSILVSIAIVVATLVGVVYFQQTGSKSSEQDAAHLPPVAVTSTLQEIAEVKVTDDRVDTVAGKLAAGEKVSNDASIKTLTLDGKTVYENEEAYFLSIEKAFSGLDKTVVLVSIGSGGSACPALYRFVLVRKNGAVEVTDEFGTCSDLLTVSINQGEISVSLPDMGGRGNEIWKFAGDKLVKFAELDMKSIQAAERLVFEESQPIKVRGTVDAKNRELIFAHKVMLEGCWNREYLVDRLSIVDGLTLPSVRGEADFMVVIDCPNAGPFISDIAMSGGV